MNSLRDQFVELGFDLGALTPGDVNWMSSEPSMQPFIGWFREYISSDNVLSPSELEEYMQLCNAGEVLHGEELDDALRRVGETLDNLELDDFDLLEERDEISILKGQIETLSIVEKKLQSSLKKQEETELALQKKLCEEQKASFKDGQILMKLSFNIKHCLENFSHSLQQLTSACLNYKNAGTHFFAQGPLEDFLTQNDCFEEHMKIFIKRQFDQKGLSGKRNIEKLLLMISEYPDEIQYSANIVNSDSRQSVLKIHPKTLWEAEVRRACAVAKLKGMEAAMEYIQSLQTTLNERNNAIAVGLFSIHSSQEDCTALESEIESLRQGELSTAAREYVVAMIAAIAEEFAHGKSTRRRYRLERLQSLHKILSRHILLTDVVWLLLRREKKLINLATQFIDETTTFLMDEHAKHLSVMELHQEILQRHEDFQKAAAAGQIPLVASLCRLMRIDRTDITSLVEVIQDLSARVHEVDQKSFMGDVLEPNLVMEKSLKALQGSLFAGPTKQPVLIPADIVRKIDYVGNSVEELEDVIKRLERHFSSKQEYFKKFPIQRGSQLLWAWFLAAPAELSAALKRAEQAVGK